MEEVPPVDYPLGIRQEEILELAKARLPCTHTLRV